MIDDPIVAAVRKVRDELAAKFNYDVAAIFRDLRERESQHGDRLVSHPPITPTHGENKLDDEVTKTKAST